MKKIIIMIGLIFSLVSCVSFSPAKKAKLVKWEFLEGHSDKILDLAFNPVTGDLASVGYDEQLILWDMENLREKRKMKAHGDHIFAVAFSPDGKLVATGGKDRMVKLWDGETLEPVAVLEGHKSGVLSIAFSPDGKFVAASGEDLTIRFWSLENYEIVDILTGHSKQVQKIRFGKNGDELISCSSDGKAKKWDIYAGLDVQTYGGNVFELLNIAFLDENRIIGANSDSTLVIWDIYNGKLLKALVAHPQLIAESHPGFKIWGLDVQHESGVFATSANDNNLILWNVDTLNPLQTIRLSSIAWCISINRSGTVLAAGLNNGKVQLFHLQK